MRLSELLLSVEVGLSLFGWAFSAATTDFQHTATGVHCCHVPVLGIQAASQLFGSELSCKLPHLPTTDTVSFTVSMSVIFADHLMPPIREGSRVPLQLFRIIELGNNCGMMRLSELLLPVQVSFPVSCIQNSYVSLSLCRAQRPWTAFFMSAFLFVNYSYVGHWT